ncbi:hypothetical protein GR131_16275 [Streptomyces sp. GF20]|uniref:hypothetical protein n=1 Tax=Streptomyces sp. GF20 TaxID=2692235 RepID=UPI0013160F2D|nr:hypothetical protein [Streptomyces sp. GF20]QHC16877.1 hypothetical protein GR131_16275 [Streptomyces sp. GF20]
MSAADRLRPAADRLARGAGRLGPALARRATAWARRGHRDDLTGLAAHLGTLLRAALIALGLYLVARAVRATPSLMWVVAGVALLAAWRAGRPAPAKDDKKEAAEKTDEPPAEMPEEVAEEVPAEAAEEAPAEAPLPTREELALALRAVADPNAHTAALAAHMQLPADRVRAALKAARIPAGGQVRMGGVTSTGIKASNFPPLPPAESGDPTPVVVAGQDSNSSSSDAPRVVRGEGTVTIYDPAETHRHHKVA